MQRIICSTLFVFCCTAAALAQTSAGVGAISGVVTDPSGATVQDATVTIDNQSLGIHRTLTTTAGGIFNAPALVPHDGYSVTVNAGGFNEFQNRSITVHVGENVSIQAHVDVKTSTTQVEVADEAPVVDTVKTDVSDDVTQNQIDNLPINGRRVDQFVLLTPAVVPDGTFGDISFRGIPGGNAFLVDGNDTTDQFYNENAGRTRIASQISQDAVQEFQVLSDAYSAEYGHAMGGVVNTVTRSGTNDYHGSGFWFFRNRTLDARDPFAAINPPESRYQFGGDFGGPLVKDKLFFFVNTEEQLRDFPLVSSIINQNINGFGSAATWKNCGVGSSGVPAASVRQCAAINALLPGFFTTLPRTADQQTAFAKIDWRPNDASSFSFDANYQHFHSPNGIQTGAVVTSGGAFNSNGNDDVNVRNALARWTFVPNGRMVNEARFGWFKDRQSDAVNNSLINPNVGTISLSVAGVGIGFANYIPRITPSENRYEFADNLSYTVGKHSVKFGVDYLNTEDYYNQLNNGNGSYSYANANAFALDYGTGGQHYSSYSQTFGNRVVDTTINEIDWYAQDQFRIRPNLTLYYGIRYEKNFLPQPPSPYVNADYPQTGRIAQDNMDFAPRIGFAWDLNKAKTVLRSGYGIYYSRYDSAMVNTLWVNNNKYTQNFLIQPNAANSAVAPVFPGILAGGNSTAAPGTAIIEFASPNLRTPYTQQADFGVQQQLTKDTSITVSYLFDHGSQFFGVRDVNQPVTPPTTVTYQIRSAQIGPVIGYYSTPVYLTRNRLDPRYNRIYQIDNGGGSSYNGLAVQIQRRFSHGFQGEVNYTWAHAIDSNLGGVSNNEFYSGVSGTFYNGNYAGSRATSSLDVRHRLVVNWVWNPTFLHRDSAFAKYVVNGWQLASITTIQTPLPVSDTVQVLTGNNAYESSTSLTGFGGTSAVPFLGINTLRLPNNTTRVDARLSKILPIAERVKTTLNFEVFNLTNTVTYTGMLTNGYNAVLTPATRTAAASGYLYPASGLGTPTASGGFPDGTNARRAQASIRIDF